jgi:hypothetical protein
LAVGDTIQHIDLSGEEPGPRAIVHELQEHFELDSHVLGNGLRFKAVVNSGSPQSLAITGCLCAITLFVIGVHGWAAACGLLLPAAFHLCFRRRPGK